MDRFRSRVASSRPANTPPLSAQRPAVDLTRVNVPVLAVNGSFDSPHAKTHRLWRELATFQNVILPERTHLTAIAAGASPSQLYVDAISRFIDMFDLQ